MNKYYCPYCSPHYQLHQLGRDGILICGHCGDPLLKKKFFKPIKIISILIVAIFLSPFIFTIFQSIRSLKKQNYKNINENIVNIDKGKSMSS